MDKVVAKKKEIKWDLGPRITEEEQIKEAKKVSKLAPYKENIFTL